MSTELLSVIDEQSTATYSVSIVDPANSSSPVTTLDSCVLTLWDEDTETIINLRNKQNVLNTNGGTFVNGVFTFQMTSSDTTLVNPLLELEKRNITIDASWNGSAGRKTHNVSFLIRNLEMIT